MRTAGALLVALALLAGCGDRKDAAAPPPSPTRSAPGVEQAVTDAEDLIAELEAELAEDAEPG